MLTFDGDPTADAEQYNKLDRSICDEHASQVIRLQNGLTCVCVYSRLVIMHLSLCLTLDI